MPSDDLPEFRHGAQGMTRFPPNVEQIAVRREGGRVWLIARRNEVELSFPLSVADVVHLARLLVGSPREAER